MSVCLYRCNITVLHYLRIESLTAATGIAILHEIPKDSTPLSEAIAISDDSSIFVGSMNSVLYLHLARDSKTVSSSSTVCLPPILEIML